ncbi:GNAT family N-acetyltransferase [Aspergillus undulatus]|uniref:GNAT family N-acetyltransferase n=1 Tax=Aspergillus undulatus TaxID=1810928 RepID=UPI003CCCB483
MTTTRETEVQITRALPKHTTALKSLTTAAFTKYIERLGRPPAPMLVDYEKLLSTPDVFVYVLLDVDFSAPNSNSNLKIQDVSILGSITLYPLQTSLQINNLVVDPNAQGRGYGRLLIEFAEAKARELGREAATLATNVKMVENIAVYTKLGYAEVGRGVEDGYERVFFRKEL